MKTQNTGKMGYITSCGEKKKKKEITYLNFANVVSLCVPLDHIAKQARII